MRVQVVSTIGRQAGRLLGLVVALVSMHWAIVALCTVLKHAGAP